MTYLAGDIGGTNTRLALFEEEGGRLVEKRRTQQRTPDFAGLAPALREFLRGEGGLLAGGFGVAGPVRNGRARGTNIPWVVDAAEIRTALGVPAVVVNDLAANGWGIGELPAASFAVVNEGEEDPAGAGALIAAGTGLGEAILVRRERGGPFEPLPSEGGHTSFGPRDDEEIALWKDLSLRYGHVSYERILSGPGLANLYRFARQRSGVPEPEWLREEIAEAGDPAPAVSAAALSGRDPVCERTLYRFVALYGSEAANLALKALATGGVFVGGGIAPKILPVLLDGGFFSAFCDKGRFGPLLSRIPIRVILDDSCALRGAARCAVRAAREEASR